MVIGLSVKGRDGNMRGWSWRQNRIEPLADGGDGGAVFSGEVKVRIYCLSSLDKEFDCGIEIKRRHLETLLCAQMQPFATGR